MKTLKIISVVCLSAMLFSGCMPAQATGIKEENIDFIQLKEPKDGQETAVITTSVGTITMMLFEKEAPKTVANFKQLVNEGFYNNKDLFVEQESHSFITGASDELGGAGKVATGDKKPIECEVTPNLWHFSGAVSVLGYEKSKLSKKVLSDSRFFIIGNLDATTKMASEMEQYDYPHKVIEKYKEYGGMPQYTGRYTVFGQVIDGMDVVEKISQLAADKDKKPVDNVKLEKIELSTYHK